MPTNDYVTLEEMLEALPDAIPTTNVDYDNLLIGLITRACRAFDRFTNWEPGAFAQSATDEETRYYDGSGGTQQWIDPCVAIPSAVAVSQAGGRASSDYTTYASTDWFMWPYNADDVGEPYLRIDLDVLNGQRAAFYRFPQSVQVTAPFGYCDTDNTPDDVKQAMIVQVGRWYGRARQGYADTGAIVELGQLRYTQRLDPDVAETIAHYKRIPV